MEMQMTFSSSLPFQVLFSSWNVNTYTDYAWTFVVCVLMGFTRQLLAATRHELVAANRSPKAKGGSGDGAALLSEGGGSAAGGGLPWLRARLGSPALRRNLPLLRALDVLLFASTLTLSYLNMLVVMVYNPGLMGAIVVGEGVGFGLLQPLGGYAPEDTNALAAAAEGCCG